MNARPIFWVGLALAVLALVTTKLDGLKALIAGEEGLRLKAYQDTGGAWTIGYGHLITPTDRVIRNGGASALFPYGDVREITQEEADAFFDRDTTIARNAVQGAVKVPLRANEFAALASLTFNIGASAFRASTLLRKLNSGERQAAADQFRVWVYDNGVKVPGLVKRRERERAIFLS